MARLKRSPAQDTLRASANNTCTASDSGRQISPGLTTNLPSNNPFRNRAVSPANSLPSPLTNSFGNISNTAPERPTSRNPFLDQSEKKNSTTVRVRSASPEEGEAGMAGRASPSKPLLTGHAVDLFVGILRSPHIPVLIAWNSGQSHAQRRSFKQHCTTSRHASTV